MKSTLLLLALCGSLCAASQYNVTFYINAFPAYHAAKDPVYIAGTFNNWKPDSTRFETGTARVTLSLDKGSYEYKLTRGNWQTAEAGTGGAPVENRMLTVTSDTLINLVIKNWTDHFPQAEKKSTAGKNVHVLDTAFYIPQLARYRRIWVYVPESYATSHKKYPVLYLQDGQNVFDEKTAFSGEWGVDEALDTLGPQVGACIVVAVDHGGGKRINEYSPYNMAEYGNGGGDAYVDFLVKTLKPFIRKQYRVKKGRKHQAIAGSSMGGLISFYALLRYPKAFGSAGIFSPAFWIAPQLQNTIALRGKQVKAKIYFYAGKDESKEMTPDLLRVFGQMSRHSRAKMTTVIRTGGRHTEAQWRQEFPQFYKWLRPPVPRRGNVGQ